MHIKIEIRVQCQGSNMQRYPNGPSLNPNGSVGKFLLYMNRKGNYIIISYKYQFFILKF